MFITKDTNPNRNYNEYYEIDEDIATSENTFRIGDQIGVGGNAAVYECIDRRGQVCAIKFLLNISNKSRKRFEQEANILLKLDHRHIVKCIDNGQVTAMRSKDKQMVDIPFIIMERADMNIVDYIKKNGVIEYDIYAPQLRGLADALAHLHKHAIHRDIKPENILVKGETWLLSDFGLCTAVESEERIDVTKPHEKIGPKYWLSPEATDRIYFGENEIDSSSDIYQLCAVFWFIITRRYPLGIIDKDDYSEFDETVCNEILRSLRYNKEKRAETAQVLYDSICNVTINKGATQ